MPLTFVNRINKTENMSTRISLASIFEANKTALAMDLQGLKLPQDAQKVQNAVSEYLDKMFDGEGDFRQQLTQSEDYILQAALSLLNAQQEIAKQIMSAKQPRHEETLKQSLHAEKAASLKKDQFPYALGGTLVGGAAGAFLGTWCAVFGAIAGTAVVLYYASMDPKQPKSNLQKPVSEKTQGTPLNVDAFMAVVSNICGSIDSLIDMFRSQIKRVIDKYESQPKPSIERDYRFLLESIQSLLGYERVHDTTEDKYVKKLQTRIEDLAENLENYNLAVENYDGSNAQKFEQVPSAETTEPRMVYPAITKDGQVVLKGKVFIPKD